MTNCFAYYNFNLRHYNVEDHGLGGGGGGGNASVPSTLSRAALVWRCGLTVSKPVLKPPLVSALETKLRCTAFNCSQFQLAPLHPGLAARARPR
jgi:hypothetical protein